MFAGTYTALVTPFRNDRVDETAFVRLIEGQVAGGVDGIVPVGTTGESPTLSHDEHIQVLELAVKTVAGRCKVIGGAGSNSTAEAVEMTRHAARVGCDATLQIAPYYNKPSQEGLFRHFAKIAEATPVPVILYSIPSRCGIEIGVETTVRLAQACPTIVALKEAGGSVERVTALRAVLPPEFEILSGDDSLTLPFISAGGNGVISVASNLVPRAVANLVRAALAGDFVEARRLHFHWHPLFKDLFIEPNPVPAKHALALRGEMLAEVRLPLCEMGDAARAKLEKTLRHLQLIS